MSKTTSADSFLREGAAFPQMMELLNLLSLTSPPRRLISAPCVSFWSRSTSPDDDGGLEQRWTGKLRALLFHSSLFFRVIHRSYQTSPSLLVHLLFYPVIAHEEDSQNPLLQTLWSEGRIPHSQSSRQQNLRSRCNRAASLSLHASLFQCLEHSQWELESNLSVCWV